MNKAPLVLAALFTLTAACGSSDDPSTTDVAGDTGSDVTDTGADTGEDTGEDTTPDTSDDADTSVLPAPTCVWNHAYQENYEADTVDAILAGATGCYVLLDPVDDPAARDAIDALHAAGNTVGCYMSVGTCEAWRPDFDAIRGACTNREWPEWPGEYFVNDPDAMLPHIVARIATFADDGCDMVEFDNMDFFWESDTFDLGVTEAQGIAYAEAVCQATHDAGMRCMAKNYIPDGSTSFDGGTFESYSDEPDWWEHDHLATFVDAALPSVIFHYDEPDCESARTYYRDTYGDGILVLCEDPAVDGYRH